MGTNAQTSTEMRDTARLEGGRVVFDRGVIMRRAWKRARYEFDHGFGPLRECFGRALRESWKDAKAIAFRLQPPVLSERDRLSLEIMGLKGADRAQSRDGERIAAAEATLAALDVGRGAPIRADGYRAARAERLQAIRRTRGHIREFGHRAFVADVFGARLVAEQQELAAMRRQLRAAH